MKKNKIFHLITNPFFALLILLPIVIMISLGNMSHDEGMWSYIGRVWSENGIPPYVGTIENKTPGIFALNAISYSLFGVNIFFLRGLGVLSIILSSLVVYGIGQKIHSHFSGIFSMYIFGLSMTWKLFDGNYIAHTEVFMVLFSTLSFYFAILGKNRHNWKYWFLFAGLSMGFAIAFKQIALTSAVALLIFIIVYPTSTPIKQNKYILILLLISGIFISTFFSIIPLILSGVSIMEYINGAWLILLNEGSSSNFKIRLLGFFQIWEFSRIVIFYPYLFLFFFQKELIKNKTFVGLLIWLIFDFIGVNASGFYYDHQIKQLLPALSIIIGILLSNFLIILKDTSTINGKHVLTVVITIFIAMFPFQSFITNEYRLITGSSIPDYDKETGIWLKDNTHKDDYIYALGSHASLVSSYSERVSSSKHFSQIFITTNSELDILFSELAAQPPAFITISSLPKDINYLLLEDRRFDTLMKNYIFIHNNNVWNIYKKD